MQKDHLVSLDVVPRDRPSLSMHMLTLLQRIRVAHGRGDDCVRLQFGYDFDVQVNRVTAEMLRDDITHWLNRFPADDADRAGTTQKGTRRRKDRTNRPSADG